MADPYTTLGVARGASDADIKKAYRKLAKELHPDTNQNNPKAAERFSRVTAAYDLLGDKAKRASFDRGEIDGDGNPANPFAGRGSGGGFQGRAGGFGGAAAADIGDIFEGLFGATGARQHVRPKGGTVSYRLAVPFEDAAASKPQRITLSDGKTIDLRLPAGVETGTQVRVGGKGEAGPGGNGDAIISIEIGKHAFYTRDGDHVRLDLPVTLREAVNGGAVKVPTVEGPVMLNIPKGSTSGKVLRLKARGFTGKTGVRGDQLVTLMIDVPASDEALQDFVTGWSDNRPIRGSMGV